MTTFVKIRTTSFVNHQIADLYGFIVIFGRIKIVEAGLLSFIFVFHK